MSDFYTAARREVARVLAQARRGIDTDMRRVKYGTTAINTSERYKARCKAWRRNKSGWNSRAA